MNLLLFIRKSFNYKRGLLILLVLVVGLYSYYNYQFGYEISLKKGPKQFSKLLELADNVEPSHSDLYISSYYKPDNPLFEPLLLIQKMNWEKAKIILKQLHEQGNKEATYWLAMAKLNGPSVVEGEGMDLLKVLADNGNPYAALRLVADLNPFGYCSYWNTKCDDKYFIVAQKLFLPLIEEGDIRATYYALKLRLLLKKNPLTTGDFNEFVDVATRAAQEHFYRPMLDLLDQYIKLMTKENKTPAYDEDNAKAIYKLLKLAYDNNYYPAASILRDQKPLRDWGLINEDMRRDLMYQSIFKGSNLYMDLWVFETLKRKDLNLEQKAFEAYTMVYLQELYYQRKPYIANNLDDHLKIADESLKQSIQEKAREKAKSYLDKINPIIVIDPLHMNYRQVYIYSDLIGF